MMPHAFRVRQAATGILVVFIGALAVSCGSPSAGGPGSGGTATSRPSPSSPSSPGPVSTTSPGFPAETPTTPGSPTGLPPCSTSALRVTLGPWNGAAAGTFYRNLDFTNVSGARCTLYGYPGVSFVTAIGGRQVGAAADRNVAGKRLVVLAPGSKAHATLIMADLLIFSPSVCRLQEAHWLRVYPPNQYAPAYVAWTTRVCSGAKPVYFFVWPVRPGA